MQRPVYSLAIAQASPQSSNILCIPCRNYQLALEPVNSADFYLDAIVEACGALARNDVTLAYAALRKALWAPQVPPPLPTEVKHGQSCN